jgi:hypothetical protein
MRHTKATYTIGASMGPPGYYRPLSIKHNNSIESVAIISVFEIRVGLNETIYETEGEAYLAATGVTLASDIVDAVALPGIWQAEEASEAEAPIVEAVLEEIAGTR